MVSVNNNINEILALHFAGEKLTNEQEEILIDWVCLNKEEYRRLSEVFETSAGSDHVNFNVEQAWNKVDTKLKKSKVVGLSFRDYLSRAACIAVILGISLFFLHRNEDNRKLYSNASESLLTVVLPDSSAVTLYPQAKVSYLADAKSNERKTELEGKAFFKVKPNSKQPFVVSSNATSIRVLGTSFLVDGADHSETGVFVREGVVQVAVEKDKVILKADEQAISSGGNIIKSKIENPEMLFEKHLTQKRYHNTPLSQIIRDIEEEFNVQIRMSDELENTRISTRLKFVNLEEILSEISYICNINYKRISDKKFEFFKP